MKKFLLFFAFACIIQITHAQYYTFLTFGYNGGISRGQSVVNTFVNDYNNTRSYLTQKMNQQDYLQGFTGSWGFGTQNVFIDFMYTNKYSMHTATGIPSAGNTMQRRDVRFTHNTFSIGIYFISLRGKNFRGPGLSVDFGKIKQRTRYGDAGSIEKTPYDEIAANNSTGLTLCYNFKIKLVKGVFLGFRPYYQFLRCESDIYPMASAVNHGYTGTTTKLKGGNYGLQVNIGFGTYHYN